MEQMSLELKIQIIISAVSFAGVLLGIVIAWAENKRLKYIETITNQTINNMLFLRRNSASFSILTKPEVIEAYMKSGREYIVELIEAAVNIEAIMKYSLDVEREIMNVVRRTTKQSINYYKKPTKELEHEIRDLNKQFYNLMTIYDYSDWQYIKSQASKRPYKSFPKFMEIYNKQLEEFAKAEKPLDW